MTALHGTAVLGLLPLPSIGNPRSFVGERWESALLPDWATQEIGRSFELPRHRQALEAQQAGGRERNASVQ
jgi:hypothetical protein